jgi:hypothetical protein
LARGVMEAKAEFMRYFKQRDATRSCGRRPTSDRKMQGLAACGSPQSRLAAGREVRNPNRRQVDLPGHLKWTTKQDRLVSVVPRRSSNRAITRRSMVTRSVSEGRSRVFGIPRSSFGLPYLPLNQNSQRRSAFGTAHATRPCDSH